MCEQASKVKITKSNTASDTDTLLKKKLNPKALEFVSQSSSDSTTPISSTCSEASEEDDDNSTQKNSKNSGGKLERRKKSSNNTGSQMNPINNYNPNGWESPQGVLPPSPANHPNMYGSSGAHPPEGPSGSSPTSRRWDSGASSPPPAPHMMLPAYSWTHHPHGYTTYGPPHHMVYGGLPDGAALERAASPPPGMFPSGASPPLAPGFISVPLPIGANPQKSTNNTNNTGDPQQPPGSPTATYAVAAGGSSPPPPGGYGSSPIYASSPHAHMIGPHPHPHHPHHFALSSSPPGAGGHYVYMPTHPHHHPHMHHQHQHGMDPALGGGYYPHLGGSGDLSHKMGSMELGPHNQGGTIAGPSSNNGNNYNTNNNNNNQNQSGLVKPGPSESRASARIARSHRAGGLYNPNDFTFKVGEAEAAGEGARKTIMIRNIPNKYTQKMMLSILEKSGFNGTFDFFYLPIDFRNRCNLGYAFVNFISTSATINLYKAFHSKRWDEYNSKKVCEISYGRVQGKQTLVDHFKSSKFPSDDIEYMPLVYTLMEDGSCGAPVPIHDYLEAEAPVEKDGNEDGESEEEVESYDGAAGVETKLSNNEDDDDQQEEA